MYFIWTFKHILLILLVVVAFIFIDIQFKVLSFIHGLIAPDTGLILTKLFRAWNLK